MSELFTILERYAAARASNEASVLHLATLARTAGSTYRRPGARTLFVGDETVGLVSGGCIEADLALRRTLDGPTVALHRYDLDGEADLLFGFGTGCKGTLEILLERCDLRRDDHALADLARAYRGSRDPGTCFHSLAPETLGARTFLPGAGTGGGVEGLRERLPTRTRVAFFGAAPDVIPLLQLCGTLGWERWVVDHRPHFLAQLPAALVEERRIAHGAEGLRPIAASEGFDAALLMTHSLEADAEALQGLSENPAPPAYVGLLGPVARREALVSRLAPGARARLAMHGPAGLDLGGDGPEAVALAIVAEMHARLHAASGAALHLRKGPIHGHAA